MRFSRKARIALGLCLIAVIAGCAGFGDDPDRERLGEDVEYDWNRSADATYDVQPDEYHAIVTIDGTGEIELWRPGNLGGEEPLPARGVKFRYPNGTVVGLDAFEVERTSDALVLVLPADEGTFAYAAESGSRSVFAPIVGNGTHEVILPPGMRTDVPVLGNVDPGGSRESMQDNRVHVTWTETPDSPIYVQYYLQRDLYIFGGVVALMSVLGAIGFVYFRLQIRRLEERRKDAGLDVEE